MCRHHHTEHVKHVTVNPGWEQIERKKKQKTDFTLQNDVTLNYTMSLLLRLNCSTSTQPTLKARRALTHGEIHAVQDGANPRCFCLALAIIPQELQVKQTKGETYAVHQHVTNEGREQNHPSVSTVRWRWWRLARRSTVVLGLTRFLRCVPSLRAGVVHVTYKHKSRSKHDLYQLERGTRGATELTFELVARGSILALLHNGH